MVLISSFPLGRCRGLFLLCYLQFLVLDKTDTVQLLGYRNESVFVRPLEEIVRDEVDTNSIAQRPERAQSATVHVFKIHVKSRIFKVVVYGSEVVAIERH